MGLTVNMKRFGLIPLSRIEGEEYLETIDSSNAITCFRGSLSLVNSEALRLRQFETISPVSVRLNTHDVPSVMMTASASRKNFEAV